MPFVFLRAFCGEGDNLIYKHSSNFTTKGAKEFSKATKVEYT